MLTILSVARVPASVSRDACGGAEQILSLLDAAIVAAGHKSIVIASEGSSVAGKLIAVPRAPDVLDEHGLTLCRAGHRAAVELALAEHGADIVHMHGVDYPHYMPAGNVPVLVTLHCPTEWNADGTLAAESPRVWLNPVSASQAVRLPRHARVLEPIENGVAVDAFADEYDRRDFALVLSRIAPETSVHIALDAAHAGRFPLIVAGELRAFPEHQRYFEAEVEPRLDATRRWIGPVSFAVKRRLLAEARCLLDCSGTEESNSLAACEALASGTPVVALARGALVDTVDDGSTGFLVSHPRELPRAVARSNSIDRAECRRVARVRFDAKSMARAYLALYARLAGAGGAAGSMRRSSP